jgi:hypothetical protein
MDVADLPVSGGGGTASVRVASNLFPARAPIRVDAFPLLPQAQIFVCIAPSRRPRAPD